MKNVKPSILPAVAIILATLFVGVVALMAWQNHTQQQKDDASARSETAVEANGELQTITSTVKDWTVSLQAPEAWKVEVNDDKYYDYSTGEFEGGKNTILTHPNEKVSIYVRHMPLFSGDGTCVPSPVIQLEEEEVGESGLVYVEGVSESGSYMLGLASVSAISEFGEAFDSCHFAVASLIGADGMGVGLSSDQHNRPFVSVSISPSFADYSKTQEPWGAEAIMEFLDTEEYAEAKAIVRSLNI